MGKSSHASAELGPVLGQVVAMMGRRADDPELVAWVTETLGKKVPASMSASTDGKYAVAKKLGVELLFRHEILHDDYPPVNKTKRAFVPRLSLAWLRAKLPDPLPFGLKFDMSDDELRAALGEPTGVRGLREAPYWQRPLDPARGVVLTASSGDMVVQVNEARALARDGHPPPPVAGLFIGWAAQRGLLDGASLGAHTETLEAVRARRAQGSRLYEALPRGLWDQHLRDVRRLRNHAFGYFHNVPRGHYVRDDLVEIFGGRDGPHGHVEAALDDDDWAAVDKATSKLDERFADFL